MFPDRPEEARPAVHRPAQADQLVGDHLLVVEQPLHPGADGGLARVADSGGGALLEPRHHLGLVGDVAGRVEHHPHDPVRVVGARPGGDPAAERLPRQVSGLDAERVHQPGQVGREHVDGVGLVGQAGPAVADHVVGGHPEVGRQAGDVAGVGLQVAAGTVQQHQVGSRPGPRVRTPLTSTWRSSWSVSASSPQMLMCSERSVMTGPLSVPGRGRSGRGPRRWSPGPRSAGGRRRAPPAGGSSRW